MSSKTRTPDRILRQSVSNRISHWLVAISTFVLIFSGLGQMPMYARYGLSSLSGMAWTADYQITLAMHYSAGALLFFAVVYHVANALFMRSFSILPRRGDFKESVLIIKAMLGKGEEPASHKYLAEQRLAYAFIGISTLVVLVSGLIKVVKNLPGVQLDPTVLWWTTFAHNASAVLLILGIVGHFAAFIFKENRALLPAMFDGRVDRAYAKHRHSLWHAEITGRHRAETTPLPTVEEREAAA